MNQVVEIFLKLVKSEILATPLEDGVAKSVTPDIMKGLYTISKQHDMTHIVAAALQRCNLLAEDEISKKMSNSLYMAVWRDELKEKELQQIYQLFEEEHIAFIPLKGAVIRELYPEPWMRTSCDIDILVHEEEVERARDVLVSKLSYRAEGKCVHDISLYSPTDVHLELHYCLKEHMDNIDQLLEQVWEHAQPEEEGKRRYRMEPEYMLFYLFAHMSYHFLRGGCGVRNFIDIWLVEKKMNYRQEVVDSYCAMCNIKVFVNCAEKMACIWMEDKEHDEITMKMQERIMHNGLYGTKESNVTSRNTEVAGKGNYVLYRLFMPRRDLCVLYPRLEKYPFLYPYYVVKRWTRLLDSKRARNAMNEMKIHKGITKESIQSEKELFDRLGLR